MVSKYFALFVFLQVITAFATATSLCPECVKQAGCPQNACPCTTACGAYLYPPNNPENISYELFGCVQCPKESCVVIQFKCVTLLPCGINEYNWVRRPGFGPQCK